MKLLLMYIHNLSKICEYFYLQLCALFYLLLKPILTHKSFVNSIRACSLNFSYSIWMWRYQYTLQTAKVYVSQTWFDKILPGSLILLSFLFGLSIEYEIIFLVFYLHNQSFHGFSSSCFMSKIFIFLKSTVRVQNIVIYLYLYQWWILFLG